VVVSHDEAHAELSWDDAVPAAGPRSDSWVIDSWSSGRSGPIGVALLVTGRYGLSTDPVRRAASTPANRLSRLLQTGTAIPLCAVGHISCDVDADRDAIVALIGVLAQRPAARDRLGDERVVARLARDMASHPHDAVPFKTGGKRKTFEILNAMRLLGYEHRLGGRPLPDEDIGSVETIASQVLDRLRTNPYARAADVTKDEVHAAVTKYYTSVPPWPFWALLDGAT